MIRSYPYCQHINLFVKGRISKEDAARQENTAREVLKRLATQPGVVVADEVGMGKTFVALAVAVSVALRNKGRHPVVVMVPSSLKEKWPTDFKLFCEKCISPEIASQIRCGKAERAVEFLKLLDDPVERRCSVIFVTHGAVSRGLGDKWMMLALVYQALKGRHGGDSLRRTLSHFLGELLHMHWVNRNGEEIWLELLQKHPSRWLEVLQKWGIHPDDDDNTETVDDPVPRAVYAVLPRLDTGAIYESLKRIPRRRSKRFDQNLREARRALKDELRETWETCVRQLRLRLPLLILDEAHHLKNASTRLASLFQDRSAEEDADELAHGPLAGVFRRMLFLTATPFQLGHHELCSVLQRFEGIAWTARRAPACGLQGYQETLAKLREALDGAQTAAVSLDTAWGRLKSGDLQVDGHGFADICKWWASIQPTSSLTPTAEHVVRCYRYTQKCMTAAEELLKPWVIRHLRSRQLPAPHTHQSRRRVLSGRSITNDSLADETSGLEVSSRSVLPFLLAARAACQRPESRPVFAEGLASSYEAFLHTRWVNMKKGGDPSGASIDGDDDDGHLEREPDEVAAWYLDRLEECIPRDDAAASASHPKIAATVAKVAKIWESGEKVLVFCHFVATGRTLRQRISEAIDTKIQQMGAEKLGCPVRRVRNELELLGRRFFVEDSPARRACDAESERLLSQFPGLVEYKKALVHLIRRYLRTPSFLVRYFGLESRELGEKEIDQAMQQRDSSGLTLRELLQHFLCFLVERCGVHERQQYIEALSDIQTGSQSARDVKTAFSEDEIQGSKRESLVPNVRLVNGATLSETRQTLMRTFNTPFYPEVLIASSVMAEGVDLHVNCRYVIHHDLCWNPSTLEQRNGRVDRIGSKVELCGLPIQIYLPYIGETQDEKQYRVVMDRERWFSVVMGEKYQVDLRTCDKLAERLPFPEEAASALAFRLQTKDNAQKSDPNQAA